MINSSSGNPQPKSNEQHQKNSVLSPRTFFKLITNSIEEFRKNNLSVPTLNNYEDYVSTFNAYLDTFKSEYKKYLKRKKRDEASNNQNQEIQQEQKINKIPLKFFNDADSFELEISKKAEFNKKQEELSGYLDEVQVVLFTKSGKYPEKANIILQNMDQLNEDVEKSLQKVLDFRKALHQKVILYYAKQMKVSLINSKIQKIKQTLEYAKIVKKVNDLKELSKTPFTQQTLFNDEMLLKIKKNQLQICNRFVFIKSILQNIENYRGAVKSKLYRQFVNQLQYILNRLLSYNKEEWKSMNKQDLKPAEIGNNQNNSYCNLTILNETYFVFDTNSINIVKNNPNKIKDLGAASKNEDQITLDLDKIYNLWVFIQKFDLYDQTEINEQFSRILVKHSNIFNDDMQNYIGSFYFDLIKEKEKPTPTINILKGEIKTYAQFKNKQQQNTIIAQTKSPQHIEDKLLSIDTKFYLKIIKFYFQLMKKLINFIYSNRQLQFLDRFKSKFWNFLKDRINYFIELRKISHQMTIDDFLGYLQIVCYWENQQCDQIYHFCDLLRKKVIEQYLTKIQTHLLVKQLKSTIEQSTYLPIILSSENYMIFNYLLESKNMIQDQTNMSMTFNYQDRLALDMPDQQVQPLRLINKNVIYKGKTYKICDSFLYLMRSIEKYSRLKNLLHDFTSNIEEKMCEIIGFYSWYNQKNLSNNKNGAKTLKNYCTFYSNLLFLKQILLNLKITSKKIEKTRIQLNQCQTQIVKAITLTPFMMIQQKISLIYEAKISTKSQIPTNQSLKIIEILKISIECLKQYFPIENQEKLADCHLIKFLQTTIKLINKNYFGYLSNMEKRGIAQISWFLPKFKEILQITLLSNKQFINKKGQLLCANGNNTFYLFSQQIESMEKLLKTKSKAF